MLLSIIHYPITNNDLLLLNPFNITWRSRSIFWCTNRAALVANQEDWSIQINIIPLKYQYTPYIYDCNTNSSMKFQTKFDLGRSWTCNIFLCSRLLVHWVRGFLGNRIVILELQTIDMAAKPIVTCRDNQTLLVAGRLWECGMELWNVWCKGRIQVIFRWCLCDIERSKS